MQKLIVHALAVIGLISVGYLVLNAAVVLWLVR